MQSEDASNDLNWNSEDTLKIAVLADIHGNRWALEAVLEDLEREAFDQVVNLGDLYYGPLDPGGTAELLRSQAFPTICGNQDRILLESPEEDLAASASWRHMAAELPADARERLRTLPKTLALTEEVLLCHGTPDHDDEYLVERVESFGVQLRSADELDRLLPEGPRLVLCGHSHVPRAIAAGGGRLVFNPGSVGLPAYTDDLPHRHTMEAGSPEARYGVLEKTTQGWRFEHRAVPYDVDSAVHAARRVGCLDWASCLATGRGE